MDEELEDLKNRLANTETMLMVLLEEDKYVH